MASRFSARSITRWFAPDAAASGRHPHRRQHRAARLGAGDARFGAHRAMAMHLAMAAAFIGAGPAERNGVGELRLQELAVSGLVRSRHDIASRVADGGAIEVKPNACDQVRGVTLRQAGVSAGRTSLDAAEAGVDAAAHGIGVCGLFWVRTEHGADGDGRHWKLPWFCPRCSKTHARDISSERN
jgi:hypothetical protein